MTQKDKVKELVGRSLNSYHTKALQQMDRIEKKNKEQNHKISILSNELDNDYLTKTEEGSVISLEHSKEGMIYLDELQGNTLVNYCTDGSKELTLNGDIDVEGVSVTTTEGVDNGKVDVMCEGNTLINLVSRYAYHANQYSHVCFFKEGMLKPSIKYSAIILNPSNEDLRLYWNENIFDYVEITIPANSTKVFTHTTKAEMNIDEQSTLFKNAKTHTQAIKFKVILLEGDWSNKELPNDFFEGMKSVGQDDENGHKIEILSQNKNLFNINETDVYSSGTRCEKNGNSLRIIPTSTPTWASHNIKIKGFKNGETYALSCISDNYHLPKSRIALYERATNTNVGSWDRNYFTIPNNVNVEDIYLRIHCCDGDVANIGEVEISDILIEKGQAKTQFIPYAINKKEILLNEPLRGLPNGVKDRFVKIGGKWFIERNCSIEFNLADYNFEILNQDDTIIRFRASSNNFSKLKHSNNGVCNILNYYQAYNLNHSSIEGIGIKGDSNYVLINLNKSRNILSVNDLKNFIKNGLVFSDLQTPTYEPIEDAELITYLDTTHISNNSLIPCNMKIKNTGYNAIIKPSTLYTVALDTNKSGTIGMNLGGVKGTTTNNVLTLTTPATLTDDSLRLYGKGIKGSKVRLLEGDKTNWIPSHFEGMKSCFEDKVQSDGTYKMEILSNNINLLPYNNVKISPKTNQTWYDINGKSGIYGSNIDKKTDTCFELKEGYYKISIKTVNCGYQIIDTSEKIMNFNGTTLIPKGRYCIRLRNNNTTDEFGYSEGMITYSNTSVVEYTPRQHNKIQFSSIEPLRGIGKHIKDKFVLKDGKLMIERKCKQVIFNGSEVWNHYNGSDKLPRSYYTSLSIGTVYVGFKILCDKYENISSKICDGVWEFDKTDMKIAFSDNLIKFSSVSDWKKYLSKNNLTVVYQLAEPTYEEIPFELQKIILEGYENGTLFFDTNIPPTSIVTYAGETPIVKSVKLNKTEVLNNTTDINDNIIPYLMDMDYRVVCLELQLEEFNGGVSIARLFGGTYEMLQRDIQSKRYSIDEYRYRLDAYLSANKITNEEYEKLGDMLNE